MHVATYPSYTYNFPTSVRFGPDVIDELGQYLMEQGKSAPMIVTDQKIVDLPFFQEIFLDLKSQGMCVGVFNETHKNPVKSDVDKGAARYNASDRDCIIGIGGGASLDVARAIALKVNHPLDLFEYEEVKGGEKLITEEIPLFVCVPTTSGTGSEVGRSCIISDDLTKQKKVMFSPRLMADRVFADPVLTMDLPPEITATTGMDALTHHLEAYLSKGFHPICDGVALEGIRIIWENIYRATYNPTLESRSAMMIASLMGAIAIQKGTGIVHSMAHPLSTLYDTHSGLAKAVMLPYGIQFNAEVCQNQIQRVERLIGSEDLVKSLFELNEALHIPRRLRDIGVHREELITLSHLAYGDVCHLSNPRSVKEEDFLTLYRNAL